MVAISSSVLIPRKANQIKPPPNKRKKMYFATEAILEFKMVLY